MNKLFKFIESTFKIKILTCTDYVNLVEYKSKAAKQREHINQIESELNILRCDIEDYFTILEEFYKQLCNYVGEISYGNEIGMEAMLENSKNKALNYFLEVGILPQLCDECKSNLHMNFTKGSIKNGR